MVSAEFFNMLKSIPNTKDLRPSSFRPVEKADNTRVVSKIPRVPNFILDKYREDARIEAEAMRQKLEEAQKAAVYSVMENDKYCSPDVNKDEIYGYIDNAAKTLGVDPVVIAAIIRKESHFVMPESTSNGSGLMQVTTIVAKDMYQRPEIYDKSLEPILKKYKNADNLMKAIRKDPELNVMIGTALFKQRLTQAKGDVNKALVLYNTTSHA